MNYSLNNLNLDYFTSKYNTYNTNTINNEYNNTIQKEEQNIFSPINPTNLNNITNINILELSSLKNDTNAFFGVKVKKIKPNLTMNFFPKNYNPNKKTLVLDLDETLVHSSTEKPFPNKKNIILNLKIKNKDYKIYVILRPYLDFFLKEMSAYYNLYIFTASMSQYLTALLNILDKNRLIIKAFNREHCQYKFGLYFKDLSIFNVDYKNIIIIDNNPVSYALNKSNGIPIQTWIDDPNDKEFIRLIPLLKYLAKVDDVRTIIKRIIINGAKAKVNFALVNKILKEENSKNLVQDKEMIKDIEPLIKTIQKKSKSNLNLDEKDSINLFSTNKKNIKQKRKINLEKNNNNQNTNNIKENNNNKNNSINNEYKFKKLKIKKKITDKKPEDKIRPKERNTKSNIYNISIENIKNVQNNIKIVLKDKNKIIVSKIDKPKKTIKKINTNKISAINIIKTESNFEDNNKKLTETPRHKTQKTDISKSLNLKNPLSFIEKKPLDKNEDKIINNENVNLYKYFPKKETLNLQDENLIKTNVFFNNTLRKNKNNYFHIEEPYKPASKGKLIVMKIIRKKQNKNDTLPCYKFNNTLK